MPKTDSALPPRHPISVEATNMETLFLFDANFELVASSPEANPPSGPFAKKSMFEIFPDLARVTVSDALASAQYTGQALRILYPASQLRPYDLTLCQLGDRFAVIETRKRSQGADDLARLVHQATHDPLTGLPNRRQFADDLAARLDDSIAHARPFWLLQIDLDDFKPVNDTLGHPAGDRLLQLASRRIGDCVGPHAKAYRLAGDEFAVISSGENGLSSSLKLAELLVNDFKKSFTLDGIAVFVGVSIGIATAPGDGSNAQQLMKSADVALYAAKKEGRGRAVSFNPAMLQIIEQRELLRRSLRVALEHDQFFIEYQPIVERARIKGFEALLRWRHPLLGVVQPADFIPMAENDGLMPEIGLWVLERACREALNWPKDFIVAVNVSPAEFLTDGLTDRVSQTLDMVGLPADRLELEITETVLLERTVNNLDTLNTLNILGIHIALDDFGTEYSSLSYLKTFPFDTIKIDKYFTKDLEVDLKSQAIVRFVIGLAHELDMLVTAEGVETTEQADLLIYAGCDRLQGYLYSKPMQAGDIAAFIANLQPNGPDHHQ